MSKLDQVMPAPQAKFTATDRGFQIKVSCLPSQELNFLFNEELNRPGFDCVGSLETGICIMYIPHGWEPKATAIAMSELFKEHGFETEVWEAPSYLRRNFPKINAHVKNSQEIQKYLNAALENNDPQVFLVALRDVMDAHLGMAQLAEVTGSKGESVYRSLSNTSNSQWRDIRSILDSLGFKLAVEPLSAVDAS